MDKLTFSKADLTLLVGDPPEDQSTTQRVFLRLWELYSNQLMYGYQLPAKAVLGVSKKLTIPQHKLLNQYRLPVGVFRSYESCWTLQAVFEVYPLPDPQRNLHLSYFFKKYGVEYMSLPLHLINLNYLYSSDFRSRSRRAIYSPLRIAFRQFPKPPAGGWPMQLPAPSAFKET
jgi:hypothetical protein